MTTIFEKNHPARDPGFLSRLHDGDLQPSERAHFETHRAHCNECRRLAAEYEHALSLFRSARSAPPPADMANRVLRRVQAVGRRSRPAASSFFSVDWRWASAFAAALLVLLVAAPALLRRELAPRAAEAPIPVALEKSSPRAQVRAPAAPPAPPAAAAREEKPPKLLADTREAAPSFSGRANEPRPAANAANGGSVAQEPAPAQADRLQSTQAERSQPGRDEHFQSAQPGQVSVMSQRPADKGSAAPAPPAAAQAPEAARDQSAARADLQALERTARLDIRSDDGLGSPPLLLTGADQAELSGLRGQSFVLVVSPSGSVSDVREAAKKEAAQESRRRQATLDKEKDAAGAVDPLKRLVFAPSDRSRRVLVRVQ
jgi:hypothetical protein